MSCDLSLVSGLAAMYMRKSSHLVALIDTFVGNLCKGYQELNRHGAWTTQGLDMVLLSQKTLAPSSSLLFLRKNNHMAGYRSILWYFCKISIFGVHHQNKRRVHSWHISEYRNPNYSKWSLPSAFYLRVNWLLYLLFSFPDLVWFDKAVSSFHLHSIIINFLFLVNVHPVFYGWPYWWIHFLKGAWFYWSFRMRYIWNYSVH